MGFPLLPALCGRTVAELAGLLKRGETTSVAIVQAYLRSIELQNELIHAYLEVYPQDALREAAASDARRAAGVTLSIAFILQYMASGARWVEARLEIRPLVWIGGGLLIAALSGAASWVFGYPFLTSWFRYVDLPLIGKTPLASAVVFDAGVALLVVGATVLMLVAIAHQSLRTSRGVAPPASDEETR